MAGRRQHDRGCDAGAVSYQGPPNKFEAGTGNIADAVGLGEAIRYVDRVGIERIAAYEHSLLEYATPDWPTSTASDWSAPRRRRPACCPPCWPGTNRLR